MVYKPHNYQDRITAHVLDLPGAGVFAEMGLGKTVSVLTAVNTELYENLNSYKVLVVAPLRVAQEVWHAEGKKWDHLKHLRFSLVLGDQTKRVKALQAKADVYVINRDNLPWLISFYGSAFPFDWLILDELSSFKDNSARRFKVLRKVLPTVKKVTGLTGTPAPNGLMGLWSQVFLLDRGQRLGETITRYRDKYFNKKPYGFGYELRKEDKNSVFGAGIYEREIFDNIRDICISMKAADYLELPQRINNTVSITLDPATMKAYRDFEKAQVIQLQTAEITAVNAGVLCNKLLQFANGAVYDENQTYHEIHRLKLEALEEIIEAANGESVLIAYNFRSDLERINKYLKQYKPRALKSNADFADWNSGKIQVGTLHPASGGHGLNLQYGGHIIAWFGKNWGLELDQQLPARLHRQGQIKPVIVHDIICAGTMDEDVIAALRAKDTVQAALMSAVKARLKKYNVNS